MDHFICGFFGFWWWVKIFKKQIDIAKIKESDFLENLDIVNDKSKEVLEKWIVLNKDLIVND